MRWARVAMIVWAGTLAFAAVASAQSSITHTITFDPSAVEYESRDGYNLIRMEDCRFEIVPGRPMIPARTLQFSVPADMRVAEVRVLSVDRVDLGDDFLLYPAQPYARTSDEHAPAFVEPEKTVYEGTAPYPGETAKLLNNGVLSGYRIAGVKVYPFEYLPAERRLVLNRSVRIELVLEAAEPVRTIAGRDEAAERAIADRIRSIVVNPEKVDEYIGPRAEKSRDAGVAYAIITGDSYVDEFQPLADWKTLKGVKTEIFTVSWISSNYSGLDDQEKIRNFILDYEANQGLQYVLLGGDVDVVPARVVWDEVENDGIRADMYFSDTDGDWNADGDSRYGEYPSDNVDMYADIYVGRAPVNTSSEASNFVNQVLTYEGASTGSTLPTDFQEEMLFLAEILWDDPDPYTDHGILKDWIDTNYVPSNFDPITKLYERDGNLNYTSAMNALNDGPNITNHCGHCNYNVMSIGPSALYNSDMDALDNGDRKGLYYTMGCWAAAFDYDNIAEHYVNNPDGGGIAFVGNSRYGWACPGYPGECASDVFDKEFFRALFDDNIYRTGITHADHKDALVPESQSDEYMRYCLYELNLLGDPETPLWTETPQALAVNHPGTLPTGASYYTVSVTMGGSPVEDALVCLMKGTEVYETGLTNSSGQVTLEPSPDTGGSVSVTVTAQNGLPYEGSATVEEGTPPAAPTGLAAVEGDGQVSLAWDPNAEPDIDYYVLYRAQSPNPTDSIAAIDAPDTSYLDTDVENDSTYYYRVRAVDTEGDRSGYSNEVSATPFWTPSIFITHTPVEDTDECNHDIPVTATITSTVAPLLPDSILVVYETQAQRAWESAVLSATGTPNEYAGEIPGQPCGTLVNYYILAVDENHDRETDPDGAPAAYHSFTVSYTVVFEDDFETDKGWTVGDAGDDATTGIWERGDPQGTNNGGQVQPEDDHTDAPGVNCYATGLLAGTGVGSYDIDGGKTTVLSPVFDLSGAEEAVVSYWRWYSNDLGSNPGTDTLVVQVRSDGSGWIDLERTPDSQNSWARHSFLLTNYVTLTSTVQLRFIASDEGDGSLVEAALDDFLLEASFPAAVDPDLSTVEANDHVMLAPDGSGDSTLTITVTVRDGNGSPVTGIPEGYVMVNLSGVSSLGQSIHFCESGSSEAQFLSTEPTDGNGRVTFTVTEAGGCGVVTVTAEVQDIPLTTGDTVNMRSPDFTGDGEVNYNDTFQYLPFLNAATGYCGNLSGDADEDVDFYDTFKYLPALSSGATCP